MASFYVLQAMVVAFERSPELCKKLGIDNPGDCPLMLPAPNPVMTAKDNATFDEHQSV